MDLASIFTEPVLRRCWLLNKALENASLEEALKLAQAADEFLSPDRQRPNGSLPNRRAPLDQALPARRQEPALAAPAELQGRDPGKSASSPSEVDGHRLSPGFEPGDAGKAEASSAESLNSVVDEPIKLSETEDTQTAETQDEELERNALSPSTTEENLAVLASLDEIVRYLRQRDDVVVSAGKDAFLVNGRFHLTSEELLVRANKMRLRQGKPQFQRIPPSFTAAKDADFVSSVAK
jgi:hypothetical protein